LKRLVDLVISFCGLVFATPILVPVIFLIWVQDFKSPFYIAKRVGRGEKEFNMVKLRSMVINADSSGVDSTSANDSRITRIGHVIRRFKLDELTQLWNVFLGHMSLVGPRPNVIKETNLYTTPEKLLLTVRPGITDISSIIFSDEGDILANKKDPDLAYNQLIRPWKSRLGLIYIENQSLLLDIQLIIVTVIAVISRDSAISWVSKKLVKLNVDKEIVAISSRKNDLYPYPPPGTKNIVTSR
jgi:lipopolysaccharide/colanic/teichoic acid biosynthesis glycosyltransferase